MSKKEIIKDVEYYISGKYNLGIIDDKIVKDCINKTLEAINYTHCCKSDSEQLQAVEDLKEFARNNCREWNLEEMEGIIDRL